MKSHILGGVILVLAASPAAAGERAAMLDTSGFSTLLMQDCAVTDRSTMLPARNIVDALLGPKPTLIASHAPADLADFERFSPLAFSFLAAGSPALAVTGSARLGQNDIDDIRTFSSAVAAMGEFEFPTNVVRPARSIFDTMVVVRLQLDSPQNAPLISLKGGAAAVAWHAAMIGSGREVMPRTSAN